MVLLLLFECFVLDAPFACVLLFAIGLGFVLAAVCRVLVLLRIVSLPLLRPH